MSYWFVMPWDVIHPGGVVHVVTNLYRHFSKLGVAPCVLVQSWNDDKPRYESRQGVNKLHLRFRNPVAQGLTGKISFWLTLPYVLFRLSVLLSREEVKIINPHYPNESILVFVLLKRLKIFHGRLIVSLHGSDFDAPCFATGYKARVWKEIMVGADSVVTCSEALSRRVLTKYPWLLGKVFAIHNGFDLEQFISESDLNADQQLELKGRDYILNVAAFEEKKGQDTLLNAFASIAEKYPDLMLVLIGGYTPYRDVLVELVRQLNLENRVIVLTNLPHSRLHTYLKFAKMFVLPSRIEPFGIVLLEAGAYGLPIIASKVGGIPEIISSDKMGLLVSPDNIQELVKAIEYFLDDPRSSMEFAQNIRARVLESFSWASAASKYFKLSYGVS